MVKMHVPCGTMVDLQLQMQLDLLQRSLVGLSPLLDRLLLSALRDPYALIYKFFEMISNLLLIILSAERHRLSLGHFKSLTACSG